MNTRLPRYFLETEGNVVCSLCPKTCKIASGSFGACGVRGNKGGRGIIPFYGFVSALAVDPIEKKPLYHFKSGTKILSLGFAGCNLRCPFCQNWHISQNTDIPGEQITPGEIVSAALKHNTPSIAYTYSEPLIHIEFLLDCMKLARSHGIANVLVTNGCINKPAAAEVLKLTDAANVDLKSFSAETYEKILGGTGQSNRADSGIVNNGGDIIKEGAFQTVLNFIKSCREADVHMEITTLVVPKLNDSVEELAAAAEFIAAQENASPSASAIPWHLTAYHPDYRWNAPPTNPQFLLQAANDARKILRHVHVGNIA